MPCAVPEIFWEQDELLDAIAAGRNGIVLAAHIGNWELAAAAIAAAGACLHLVVASPTNALVARLMYRLRLSWGVTPHPRERSLRPVVQALKNGAFVGTAVDQWVSRKHVNAPFFDRQTPFASGLFELATRMAVPVFAISAIRENDSASARFHISAQVIWDGSDTTESVEKLVCRWAGVLEDTVQKHPEQYLWMHDRWKLKGKLK
jgi:KDO2-lipid IV(A) lauroyltransferase